MTKPIVKTVTVAADPTRAFEVFTANLSEWWPGDRHSVSAGKGEVPQNVVLEPRQGGAIYEILSDGSRTEWGVIQRWEPPAGFEMTWHPGQGADMATRLALQFEANGAGTQVTLTHSGWDVMAEKAEEMSQHYSTGWDHVLGTCFCGAFTQ
ncbi:SRPBCC domain-containing protein [Shimia sp.]|uniref:SRPBCC domain-containing protein n=1 Tax=Shimia sp. TaxID=1954381 RepID=UPI00329A6D5B